MAAFSQDADLYILDEPTSGLDPLMEQIFQQCVLEAKANGKAVFLSSHILSEVEKLCDKVAIIREGKIIEEGTLRELRHLTRSNVIVQTKEKITGLADLPGVHHLEEKGGELTFQVDSEHMDVVMKHISPFGIVKLECMPPTLEDLFLRYYGEDEQQGSMGGR